MARWPMRAWPALVGLAAAAVAVTAAEPSVFDEEVAQFTALARTEDDAARIEAVRGFLYLRHPRGEASLLPLLESPNPDVRAHAVRALGACGRRPAVEALVARLGDPDWETRTAARDALARMTAAGPFADRAAGEAWLRADGWNEKQARLVAALRDPDRTRARAALMALASVGDTACEDAVREAGPHIPPDGPRLTARVLERVGTAKSLPYLAGLVAHEPEAAWALAELGGPEAEAAVRATLPQFWQQEAKLVCLDRLGSTNCAPHLPFLLGAFGLVTFRVQADELQRPPSAVQRAAAKLIVRTGMAPQVADLIVAECEGKRRDEDTPPVLRGVLAGMRPELRPGFRREDGQTVAQPLAALPHILRLVRDPALTPRLTALLRHPAVIVRIYAAESLAALGAGSATPEILAVVREPYPFADAVQLASGKHFDWSQGVRWRGYLCIALGKLGGEDARAGLEALALDAGAPRDVRYGAVAGLRFLRAPASAPALERVRRDDPIVAIRAEAVAALEALRLAPRIAAAGGRP